MKKFIAILMLAFSIPALAQHHGHGIRHHGYHRHYHHGHYNWVAPLVIGGVVTYALTRPNPPEPVIVQQQPIPATLPPAPLGYHWEMILDAGCNCYRYVLVQG